MDSRPGIEGPIQKVAAAALGGLFDAVSRLSPYAERTVILVPHFLTDACSSIAYFTGFDGATIGFTVAMYLCYPLAYIMHLLPYGVKKHVASFIFGAFILQLAIGAQWLHILATSLISYSLFFCLPPRISHVVVPVFLMIYLSLGHLHRMVVSYNQWKLNFITPQMVVTIKLYMLAYNLYDGEVLLRAKRNGNEVPRGTQRCKSCAIYELPSLIKFLGYTFCFSTVCAGPAIEYRTYADACSGRLLYSSDGIPKGDIPSRVWPTLQPLLVGAACMGLYIAGASHFPILDPDHPASSTPAILTESFLVLPFYRRFLYCYASGTILSMRYYFPWKSAEGSTNLWFGGFEGFDEESGKAKGFGHSSNVDILTSELTPSFRTKTKVTNKKTASWLSRYVYGRTNGSMLATYALSAFWHGFYPGYYLYFLSAPLLVICERAACTKLLPYVDSGWKRTAWNVLNFFWMRVLLIYVGAPFFLLSLKWSFDWWRSNSFYGHIACVLLYSFLTVLPTPKQKAL